MTRQRLERVLVVAAWCLLGSGARGEEVWEYLGPGVGYRPDSFCVTDEALYVGMAMQNATGLGLYRYRFAEEAWQCFAFPGERVTGVSVAGVGDLRVVACLWDSLAHDGRIQRSSDGGQTWNEVYAGASISLSRVRRAPSEPAHLFVVDGLGSTDDGLTWRWLDDGPSWLNSKFDAAYDPYDGNTLYFTAESPDESVDIYRSTDAGQTCEAIDIASFCFGIEVDRASSSRILATLGFATRSSTDAGASWTSRPSPLSGKMVAVAPWDPGAFYVLGRRGTEYDVERTADLGSSWSVCAPGLPPAPAAYPWGAELIESRPNRAELLVALYGSGVWRLRLPAESVGQPSEARSEPYLLAYPNPASGWFRARVDSPSAEWVSLRLVDVSGRAVSTLLDGPMAAGSHLVDWRAGTQESVPAGVYYLKMDAGRGNAERKIILLR